MRVPHDAFACAVEVDVRRIVRTLASAAVPREVGMARVLEAQASNAEGVLAKGGPWRSRFSPYSFAVRVQQRRKCEYLGGGARAKRVTST